MVRRGNGMRGERRRAVAKPLIRRARRPCESSASAYDESRAGDAMCNLCNARRARTATNERQRTTTDGNRKRGRKSSLFAHIGRRRIGELRRRAPGPA
ncbi:hypothetical protein WS83_07220 [Burkholderia sp. MSMB2042]|nr:hypothetical protein WS78_23635 [Burkholderia savannae]KVG38219.1 hypothetical protein WS77_21290 [Burkholderia sp. MSMB0265]KVG81316.1 hypothetical protein WS81_11665 [Burkholderia sp. MSMB2040]KVG91819.1 hypothetical protein WS82_13545 [Burkholderia sp. MSMB2041]KVG94304.1 hypothetical protein WS83_07220 [Burkholderia sp. MSMB2042]